MFTETCLVGGERSNVVRSIARWEKIRLREQHFMLTGFNLIAGDLVSSLFKLSTFLFRQAFFLLL